MDHSGNPKQQFDDTEDVPKDDEFLEASAEVRVAKRNLVQRSCITCTCMSCSALDAYANVQPSMSIHITTQDVSEYTLSPCIDMGVLGALGTSAGDRHQVVGQTCSADSN